jgi:hypothetical protein
MTFMYKLCRFVLLSGLTIALLIGGILLATRYISRYRAITEIGGTHFRLDLYFINDDEEDALYLAVSNDHSSGITPVWEPDAIHNPRVNIYRIGENEYGLIGNSGGPIRISLDPVKFTAVKYEAANSWTYIGGFDFDHLRNLRFFQAADLPECLGETLKLLRPAARHAPCPTR